MQPTLPSFDDFQFHNSRQAKIYERLQLVSLGLASFYRDACRLMTISPAFAATTHLVAHLIREIESGLRDVLYPVALRSVGSVTSKNGSDKHKKEIQTILQYFGVQEDHPIATFWLSIPGSGNSYGLAARAHRNDLASPRRNDESFQQFWAHVEEWLDYLLEQFINRYLEFHHPIDELLSVSNPTKKDAEKLRNEIPFNFVSQRYFFEKASSAWLKPLFEVGLFNDPPNSMQGTLVWWPASHYLARIADGNLPDFWKIVLTIPKTENYFINEDLCNIALKMPAEQAIELVPNVLAWLESPIAMPSPEKLGELIKHLATGGQVESSLILTQKTLTILPDAREDDELTYPRPQGRFNEWEYNRILEEYIPSVVDIADLEAFKLLCTLLETAIQFSMRNPDDEDDRSNFWMTSFISENSHTDIKGSLAFAIRSAAAQILDKNPDNLPEIVEYLQQAKYEIFHRLAKLLSRKNDTEDQQAIADELGFSRVYTIAGTTSPKSSAELNSMSVEATIDYLNSWIPEDSFFSPSAEGLAHALEETVALVSDKYADHALMFLNVSPIYISAFLGGIHDGIKQEKELNWQAILELCQLVVQKANNLPHETSNVDEWNWVKSQVASLLWIALEKDCIPYSLREVVWNTILPLTNDAEPTPEYEAQYLTQRTTPFERSLNTIRSKALHGVIHYAFWVQRNLAHEHEMEIASINFDLILEARELLIDHVSNDDSVIIRSVFGVYFPALTQLDFAWATETVDLIFPLDAAKQELFTAAWDSYVSHNTSYRDAFELLKPQYLHAIKLIGSREIGDLLTDSPDQRLTHHLMELYWNGILELDDGEGMLSRFYENSTDALRAGALEFVGEALLNTKQSMEPKLIERFKALWSWRVEKVKSTGKTDSLELSGFPKWFRSGHFDSSWALEQLHKSLEISKIPELHQYRATLEYFVELANHFPRPVIDCLWLILHANARSWRISALEEIIRNILLNVIKNADLTARETAFTLIHHLGTWGYLQFSDLLKE